MNNTGIKASYQFEYELVRYCYKPPLVENRFVTVLDAFTHHYSGKEMFHIREEFTGFGGQGYAKYKIIDREDLEKKIRSKPGNYEKVFAITYRIYGEVYTVKEKGFDRAQEEVANIMNAGGDIIGIKEVET